MYSSDSEVAEQFPIIYFSKPIKTILTLSFDLKKEQRNTHFCLKASKKLFF